MTLQSLFVLFPALISGVILVHLIWPERDFKSILFKTFLGIGIGLGLISLLFFVFLLIFNRHQGFFVLQILVMVVLIVLLIFRERNPQLTPYSFKLPERPQVVFLALAGIAFILAFAVYITVSQREPHGAWDSWMIYNRAARFIFRGGDYWRDAFSPAMYWFFHADYPPMIALNVSSEWGALGQETVRVPMLIGGSFLFGSAGLLFAGLNVYKTPGQAALAMIFLFTVSGFIQMGSMQVADVPLSFFILATGILVYLYSVKVQKGLLILAGLSAGLAAWTKNEGIFFMLASLLGLGVVYRNGLKRMLPWYMLGLIVPITILVYFKIALAPPGDLFVGFADRISQVTDLNRHFDILKQFGFDLMALLNWGLLGVYALILGVDKPGKDLSVLLAILIALLLQLAGYYIILLISPHPLDWHISALSRILLQVAPLIVFLYFSVVNPPESIFQRK